MSLGRALMVWGCTSDAGKSWIATALCRWFSDRGLRVAPFKAQNMSNNARVAEGGEMGCAQWFQAMAARRRPEVAMNPILLKPERDTRSQVVVLGQVDRELTERPWRDRSPLLWERARPSLDRLLAENDLVVIEGAGSPAEINLSDVDYVNLATARHADASCLLVSDIDRGGAFAHLHGTWSLLEPADRARLRGFVLNRFRGDPALLAPGPERLRALTGVPVVGVVPRIRHDLPDEDAASIAHLRRAAPAGPGAFRVALLAWPRVSNFDEFRRLASWPGVELSVVRTSAEILAADLLVLPGSKHVPEDLAWLRAEGLDAAVRERHARGLPVLGVCGGLQALGVSIRDEVGTEGSAEGLGILPVRTFHRGDKRVVRGGATLPDLDGFWKPLSGLQVRGYEIRTGVSGAVGPCAQVGDGLGFAAGNVLGVYLHGMLEDPELLAALFGGRDAPGDPLEATFDLLARTVGEHMDMHEIASWVDAGGARAPLPPPRRGGRLCLLTGGVRCGKSSEAERVAEAWGGEAVTFLATAQALDDEMRARIAKHRSDRPAVWETLEEPFDPASALRAARHGTVLMDCLTLLVTNLLLSGGAEAVRAGVDALLEAWEETGRDLVVVTNEVGWGIVPADPLSREFRDLLGWANQRLASRATEAWLMVSGRRLPLPAV